MKKSLLYVGVALLVLLVAFLLRTRVAENAYQKFCGFADSANYEQAMSKVDFALMLSTKPEYLDLKGYILQATGIDSMAIIYFDMAIALDSTKANLYMHKGISLKNLEQWEPAVAQLDISLLSEF